MAINPLNAELNPICHLLALLGAHHILHVSRIRVNIRLSVNIFNKSGGNHFLHLPHMHHMQQTCSLCIGFSW